ncbi:MAG TPA: peptidoglycan DD-metalloendopeptidase family protein [Terriglobia bacterium]|nr:peptidoglycan DD-metalloendopeptidase family protein [Terriglobia bacterium]
MLLARIRVVLVWTAIFMFILVVAPQYQELEQESVSLASTGLAGLPRVQVLEGTISKNATLVSTLIASDIPADLARNVAGLIRPVFDVRKIKVGNPFRVERDMDGELQGFEYKVNDESILKVTKSSSGDADYDARIEKLEFDTRSEIVDVEIQSSLFSALHQYPKGETLTDMLAQIFAWDVDFNVDIQRGALIRLIVDEQFYKGEFVKYGAIQAAQLVNNGKTYRAYRFNDSYYDEKGNAIKRAFLTSPLKVLHVTSGFTYMRMHPILGIERAHLAIDYGAPEGTSAFAVANGTVIYAGPKGDLGTFVEIRHANGMTTGYGHLSRIAPGVAQGRAIKQDDLVGFVGHTGLATGPHLHYLMTRGGKPINPSSMKAEPAIPMDGNLKPQFMAHIASWQQTLGANTQTASK